MDGYKEIIIAYIIHGNNTSNLKTKKKKKLKMSKNDQLKIGYKILKSSKTDFFHTYTVVAHSMDEVIS